MKARKMGTTTEFDLTDNLIVYLVKQLAPRRKPGSGILTIVLAKLLFLVDYEYFKQTGTQATAIRYSWYRHGPYSLQDFEPRLKLLEGQEIIRLPMTREVDGRPYNLFKEGPKPRFSPELPIDIKKQADRVMYIFGQSSWQDILSYVYSLGFAKDMKLGQSIEFNNILKPASPDEAFMSSIADTFRGELVQPLSSAHMQVIEQALKEPTNENIENARRMLLHQKRAFKLTGS